MEKEYNLKRGDIVYVNKTHQFFKIYEITYYVGTKRIACIVKGDDCEFISDTTTAVMRQVIGFDELKKYGTIQVFNFSDLRTIHQ